MSETDIAVVGMSGRFPGAPDVDVLWERVARGDDCLTDLDPDVLIAAGIPAEIVRDPDYVLRSGVLDDVGMFDNDLFGIGPRDASIMDPQHRVFLECVWEAIESAGHVPERFDGAIGVFAGCGFNTYMINNLMTNPRLVDQVGWFLLRHTSNDKDFLPTFVSYKLDLRGPSVSVQTACSTSLVAMHLAVQSLLAFECDMAVAGGATIEIPQGVGYTFRDGEVLSPDGRCHAYEAGSAGTVLTSGAGVVVLRRLADALEAGDPVLAVLKGTAVNNDGARKVGFLAPSVDGHADVVKEALAVAGLSARDIQLVDGHGTGTAVGDPIEVAALTEAFRATTAETGFCRLTSTKPNIGHLDTAAGVASVIKVVQALRHRTIPPLANYSTPNPLLDLEHSPFVISPTGSEWPADRPRRAGVSSLGVGGTNAHVVLEEAPERAPSPTSLPEQVLCLSGRTPTAVAEASERLANFLDEHLDVELADIAHTLAVGRRAMPHRRVVTATDRASATEQLRSKNQRRSMTGSVPLEPPGVAFMFPGGGSQYPRMGADLDERFEVFHDALREGIDIVTRFGGPDLEPLLAGVDADALRVSEVSLPAVFVTSVALARQWMAWGVVPDVLIGHSLGEYVAAHLAGVLTFEDALWLVISRSRLIARASGSNAAMLAIPLPEAEVVAILPDALSLSVINSADECVVAGPADVVAELADRLEAEGTSATLLKLAAAGHSSMLDPVLGEFHDVVKGMKLSRPTIPYLSNLTGTFITPEQATDPQYWVDHLRSTVRFSDCLATVLATGPMVMIELGPGQALSSYARRQHVPPVATIPVLRHPDDSTPDTAHTLQAFAKQWVAGMPVDVGRFAGEGRRRLRLPTYPFQRQRHWIEPGQGRSTTSVAAPADTTAVASPAGPRPLTRIPDPSDWFWEPAWAERVAAASADAAPRSWLLIGNAGAWRASVAAEMNGRGLIVEEADELDEHQLARMAAVAFLGESEPEITALDEPVRRWLGDASAAARSLGSQSEGPTTLATVTRGAFDADGPATRPVDALAAGIVRVAPREYPDLRAVLVDVDASTAVTSIVDELVNAGTDSVVAWRSGRRLVPIHERRRVEPPDGAGFQPGATYVITGGLGDIGFALSTYLAEERRANLVIVSSSPVPEGPERIEWLAHHGSDDPTSRRIRRALDLEAIGTKVAVVSADLGDPASVRTALDDAERRVGAIDGAVHLAGHVRDQLIDLSTPDDVATVLGAKSRGAAALLDEMQARGAGLLVLMSSTSSFLAAEGQAAYVAANTYLDSLTGQRGGVRVVAMNSGAWAGIGMAADMARRLRLGLGQGEPVTHPVLVERHVERNGTISFVGRLDTRHDWVVDEHRTGDGRALLPGTGHLELMLAAVRHAGLGDLALHDVMLLDPLVVPDDASVTVRVTLDPKGPHGHHAVLVESDWGRSKAWHLHSQAAAGPPVDTATREPVDDSIGEPIDPLAGPRKLLQFGPHWTAVERAYSDGDVAVARLALGDAYAHEHGAWIAHPALVDVATAVAVALRVDDGEAVMVPVGYEAVTSVVTLPPKIGVFARRRADSSADVLIADVTISDTDGRPVLDIEGLTLRAVADTSSFATLADDDGDIATPLPAAGRFVELAERCGIREHDAAGIFERLVADGAPRLVVSSVELTDLERPVEAAAEVAEPATPASAPAVAGVAGTLTAMWSELLGVDEISDQDNFFDLGGHSLIAIRLMARIHRELEVRLQLSTLFDAPTVAELADVIRAERPELEQQLSSSPTAEPAPTSPAASIVRAPRKTLIPLNRDGSGTPLTIVHGGGGNILFLSPLSRLMKGIRPVDGLQAVGIDADEAPDQTVEAMAERYVTALRQERPGPYMIGGYSGGGIVAMEMAYQLIEAGEIVKSVVLIDSIPAGLAYPESWSARRNVARNFLRHGWRPLSPYLKNRLGLRITNMLRDQDAEPMAQEDEDEDEEKPFWLIEREEHGFVDLFDHFARISLDYDMPIYDVDVILLKADDVWPYQPHDYYWQRNLTRQMVIVPVPGDHHTMVVQPCVAKLWERLKPLLEHFDRS